MKNKAIIIGWLGSKRCYINMPKEEAIERYKQSEGFNSECDEVIFDNIEEFGFDDEFGVYDAWQ